MSAEIPETCQEDSLLKKRLIACQQFFQEKSGLQLEGKLVRVVGLKLEVIGCKAPIGSRCIIDNNNGEKIIAEVVGFSEEKLFLMSTSNTQGIMPDAKIYPTTKITSVPVGEELLGRVIDGEGQPLDGKSLVLTEESYPLFNKNVNPLLREPISQPLDVGVQAINSLFTVGRGQRMGLFAGSGVGKSILLGMMTKFTEAEVIVVGLIGERGREVKEFIEDILGEQGLQKSVVVAAPADTSALMRLQGAMWATTIAEYFRDQGKNVLLIIDSLTRFAQAQREIGLAVGEPPTTKGYPPSVFAKLPQLVERAGNGVNGKGSITAFYTVLVEGDDVQEPIADASRAILDGHLILSRSLAESGFYPAIDLESSISRVMPNITATEHQNSAITFKHYYSKFQQNRDLINIGAYVDGSDPDLDKAIQYMPSFMNFLRQDMATRLDFNTSLVNLNNVLVEQTADIVNAGQE